MRTFSFVKNSRLLKSKEFYFNSSCHFIHSDYFRVCYRPSYEGKRLGISVSKKVIALAVGRNRIKRILRDIFRIESSCWPVGDFHIQGKSDLKFSWRELTRQQVAQDLSKSITKLSQIGEEKKSR